MTINLTVSLKDAMFLWAGGLVSDQCYERYIADYFEATRLFAPADSPVEVGG
jgi:hypothetical protein